MGADTGLIISVGQRVTVRLVEAVPITGGLTLELLELDNKPMPAGPSTRRPNQSARRPAAAKARSSFAKRKVERRRP